MNIVDPSIIPTLVNNGVTIGVSGSGTCCLVPDEILKALEDRFLKDGIPNGLTLFHPQGFGNKQDSGVLHFAHKGMCKRVIGGHWGMGPKMGELALHEELEAYCLPQGVLSQLIRDMSGKGPGVITKIGLDTFVDPRQTGGKMNTSATDDLVQLVTLNGEEYLWYKPIPIDVAIIRGTSCDPDGYISLEEEVHYDEVLALAAAAKSNGGIVIVQVKYLTERNSLNISQVKIPGYLVDYVTVVPEQKQVSCSYYKPSLCGAAFEPISLKWPYQGIDERKIIARRQCLELRPGMLVNVGVGVSAGIPIVLAEERCEQYITFSVEQGQSGGYPLMSPDFGAMMNPRIIIDQPAQHDLYHAGLLDAACLSAGEINISGDVNVSKLGRNLTGCGGFIDISQNTSKIIFGGTLCTKSKVKIENGTVTVLEQGKIKKFVNQLQQVTFSGKRAIETGQEVVYITERCVFELRKEGITLIEIAPGIDLERDILAQMEFMPRIADEIRETPSQLYSENTINLYELWKLHS